ncbi:MAG: DsbA family oxidoreductase [Pseudomonadales bacterium]|nr:DsbA family oxidoreductase [Pseudomonadales bacterium]MCP5193418.1 DsbA family oxidoreductase [Pseudomonadales bacterium]
MNTPQSPIPIRIDIVSDVVCPWCIIGYKQLERALQQMAGSFTADIHWQPFELNPHLPLRGQDLREHIAEKYGTSPEQSRGARARLTELGESLGFSFDYYDGMRIYNTFAAHQLLHWAGLQGKQMALKLALFEAFFSRRENVGDPGLLATVAGRVGLDAGQALEVLTSGRYAQAVRQEQARWLDREVHAVPMFYFNDGYPVPGAQEAQTFVRVMEKLKQRSGC